MRNTYTILKKCSSLRELLKVKVQAVDDSVCVRKVLFKARDLLFCSPVVSRRLDGGVILNLS